MNLSMTSDIADAYKSGSQRARVVTEFWAEQNLYCPNCSSPSLGRLRNNTRASDFACPNCKFWFQLKGQKSRIGSSVTDGAYGAMMQAIRDDETPNFYFLHYDLATWTIKNLLLIPSFAFPPSAIIKRPPLAATARRAGWIGCNIDLRRVPIDARIEIVRTAVNRPPLQGEGLRLLTSSPTVIVPASEVRERFRKIKPLEDVPVTKRGWMLEVLAAVRSLNKTQFTNQDLYALEPHFRQLHPENRHIRDKIRQQLQYLAAAGFIEHPGRNEYLLKSTD
jgi:type II restriction enzyme